MTREGGEPEKSDGKFEKLLLSVVATLLAAGIMSLWQMTSTVSRLDERVSNLAKLFEGTITDNSRKLYDLDRRLDRIELGRTPKQNP